MADARRRSDPNTNRTSISKDRFLNLCTAARWENTARGGVEGKHWHTWLQHDCITAGHRHRVDQAAQDRLLRLFRRKCRGETPHPQATAAPAAANTMRSPAGCVRGGRGRGPGKAWAAEGDGNDLASRGPLPCDEPGVGPHSMDYNPTRWPESPRVVMRCAHRASNGPNYLGLCALQSWTESKHEKIADVDPSLGGRSLLLAACCLLLAACCLLLATCYLLLT